MFTHFPYIYVIQKAPLHMNSNKTRNKPPAKKKDWIHRNWVAMLGSLWYLSSSKCTLWKGEGSTLKWALQSSVPKCAFKRTAVQAGTIVLNMQDLNIKSNSNCLIIVPSPSYQATPTFSFYFSNSLLMISHHSLIILFSLFLPIQFLEGPMITELLNNIKIDKCLAYSDALV